MIQHYALGFELHSCFNKPVGPLDCQSVSLQVYTVTLILLRTHTGACCIAGFTDFDTCLLHTEARVVHPIQRPPLPPHQPLCTAHTSVLLLAKFMNEVHCLLCLCMLVIHVCATQRLLAVHSLLHVVLLCWSQPLLWSCPSSGHRPPAPQLGLALA